MAEEPGGGMRQVSSWAGVSTPRRSPVYVKFQAGEGNERTKLMKQELKVDNERRVRQRFKVNAPLSLTIGEQATPGYTRDLSNKGVYFFVASAESLALDSQFDFVIDLPPEITLSSRCQIHCVGRTLRKEATQTDLTGVAAEILNYSILR